MIFDEPDDNLFFNRSIEQKPRCISSWQVLKNKRSTKQQETEHRQTPASYSYFHKSTDSLPSVFQISKLKNFRSMDILVISTNVDAKSPKYR